MPVHTSLATMSGPTMTCSFVSNDSPCGPFRNDATVVPLVSCDRDMTSHLTSLGISLKRHMEGESTLSEIDLILNRAGQFGEAELGTMTICPKHRKELTFDWPGRKRTTCSYPLHKGRRRQVTNLRRVNASMSAEIFTRFEMVVPIGSGKCSYLKLIFFIFNIRFLFPTGFPTAFLWARATQASIA